LYHFTPLRFFLFPSFFFFFFFLMIRHPPISTLFPYTTLFRSVMRVIDLEPVATLCKAEGLALIVDSTFASPVNFRPLEHGADLVIHSATKYLNGHTDVIAGVVAGTDQVVEEVRRLMQVWGQAIDPFAAWLIDRGLRTLVVRVQRQNAIGMAVAEWCAKQDAITKVHYPGLPGHPDHELAT